MVQGQPDSPLLTTRDLMWMLWTVLRYGSVIAAAEERKKERKKGRRKKNREEKEHDGEKQE